MNQELPGIIKGLETVSEDAKSTFGDLTSEQVNWKPSAESWSIAQCYDHLIKSIESFDSRLLKLAGGTRKQSFLEKYSPLTTFFGNYLLKAIKNDSKKHKAPTKALVPPSEIAADIIDKFCAYQADLSEKIKLVEGVDWQKTVVTSPFLKIMTYRLGTAFEIVVAHEKRHFRQAKRVMETEGFPK